MSTFIRPGTLPGAHRVIGISAAWVVFSPYKDFARWPRESQDYQIGRAYAATVSLGIVWC